MFRITETLLAREVKRNTVERAKLIAYDMVIRMVQDDNDRLGSVVRAIHRWDGTKRLIIRHANHFVTLEKS